MTIKPIETVYNGYRFRSRLEARWAVFFDALEVEYKYEPEGFDLGEFGWYLPDFFMPKWNCWVEIKPDKPKLRQGDGLSPHGWESIIKDDYRKCQKLAEYSNTPVMLIGGDPWIEEKLTMSDFDVQSNYEIVLFLPDMLVDSPSRSPNGVRFNLWISSPFVPDEMFFSSSSRLFGHIYENYQKNPDYFTFPLPHRGNAKMLVKADCEYYLKEYGRPHWQWEYFITCEQLIFSMCHGKLCLVHPGLGVGLDHPIKAYQAARQARFEHGEKGSINDW